MLAKLIDFLGRLFGQVPTTTLEPTRIGRTGPDGLKLIEYYEGLRLESYQDSVGVWSIGYGDTGPHVNKGDKITKAEAERRLAVRLRDEFEPGVLAALKASTSQREFDAMVSLAYNVGVRAFANSTLVKKFNQADTMGAADEFPRWDKAGGKSLLGLRRRRAAERALFLGADADEAIREGLNVD